MPRVERRAQNQALFREVNERIAELAASFGVNNDKQRFICECSHTGCRVPVSLSLFEYARIRDDPTMFVVRPGHEDGDHEEIVVQSPDYLIVRNKPSQHLNQKAGLV